jgi:hypothetical protein
MLIRIVAFLLTSTAVVGCTYTSSYRQTNNVEAAPVPPPQVKVVRSRDELVSSWAEIGAYTGKAPTVAEAMTTAQEICGQHGANLFILNTPPFASENGFKVDGVCARM